MRETSPLRAAMAELAAAADAAGRPLQAAEVVEAARPKNSPLHSHFEWDDSAAAAEHRLNQARQLIRLHIQYEPRIGRTCRALISVPSDRDHGGGYRGTPAVLDSPRFRAEVLDEALTKLANMRNNYSYLPELSPLFDRLDTVIAQYRIEIGAQRPVG